MEKLMHADALEEFSIMELEDRLEMAERCNNNCGCPGPKVPTTPTPTTTVER